MHTARSDGAMYLVGAMSPVGVHVHRSDSAMYLLLDGYFWIMSAPLPGIETSIGSNRYQPHTPVDHLG